MWLHHGVLEEHGGASCILIRKLKRAPNYLQNTEKNILKNCSVGKKNNRIHSKKLISITLPVIYCCELLEILCYCIFLLFYDGHLLQRYQMFNKFSWKRKRTCIQITPKGNTKVSRD